MTRVDETTKPVVSDEAFMVNVREAHDNGYDLVCAHCGIGMANDGMDMHERSCPEWIDPR